MKLRTRVAVTLLASVVPLFLAAEWLWSDLDERAAVAGVAQFVRANMESGERQSARYEMQVYGPDFAPAHENAPPFPDGLRRELESGASEAGVVTSRDGRRRITVAVRIEPNANVLAECEDDVTPTRAFEHIGYSVLVIGGFVTTVLLATGPIGRRLRRLTASIHRSAAERYRGPISVTGSDEVAELAVALDAAREEILAHIEELRRRERALRDFVENTTHDVMLPLSVLQGQIVDLRETLVRGDLVSRRKVQGALEELQYLASLVQNLGAAAQLEAGDPEKRRHAFSWNALVERVVSRHATIAREKGVELDFAVPAQSVVTAGDVTMVEQALSNVVHNAVRYNGSGGHVAVLLDRTDERFSVRVFDDGPGVTDEERERLADRSYRGGDARERHPGGMGLGLSIAKAVADWHGFVLALRRSAAGGLEVEIEGPIVSVVAPDA